MTTATPPLVAHWRDPGVSETGARPASVTAHVKAAGNGYDWWITDGTGQGSGSMNAPCDDAIDYGHARWRWQARRQANTAGQRHALRLRQQAAPNTETWEVRA